MIDDIIEAMRRSMPPIFEGVKLDEFTGGAAKWRTTQNKRSKDEIPAECFVKSGPRTLIVRDPFLEWWRTTLSVSRQPIKNNPPKPTRRDCDAA